MGLRAPKGPQQPSIGNESLDAYFPKSPEQEQKMLQQMLEKQMVEGIAKQRENEAMQKEMLQKALEQSVQPDLSAAWGLVKAAGGDTSAAALSPKNLNQDVQALQQALQKTSGAITDDEINLLRTKLASAQSDSEKRKADQYNKTFLGRAQIELKKDFGKIADTVNTFNRSAGQVENTIKGDAKGEIPVAQLNQVLTQFGKMMGEAAVQTDRDSLRAYQATVEALANQLFNRFGADGKVSKDDPSIKAMNEQLRQAKYELAEAAKGKADYFRDIGTASDSVTASLYNPGNSGDVAYKKVIGLIRPSEAKAATAGGLTPEEQAELDQLEKEASGGK